MKLLRSIISMSLIMTTLLTASGCAYKEANSPAEPAKQQVAQTAAAKEKAAMDNFNALLRQQDVSLPQLIAFIDENMAAVSPDGVSSMIIGLEKVQKERLPKLQDKFGADEAVQKVLAKIYRGGLTNQAVNSIENQAVKDLLLVTQNSGFKVETAEGMFYPVINYAGYKKYQQAVTPDIAAFIDIMAVESEKTPIKDAAIMISWSEIIQRAMAQERFIKDYGYSAKMEDIRQLLKQYLAFSLYGANNTPLFSYDTKQLVPAAKEIYLATTFAASAGSYSKVMNDYIGLLKKNDYKLTDEVQAYRNKVAEELR